MPAMISVLKPLLFAVKNHRGHGPLLPLPCISAVNHRDTLDSMPVRDHIHYRYAASKRNNDPPFPDHFFAVQMDFVYQLTNRDRCKLFMESVDPNDPLGITPPVGAGHARDD